MNFEFKLYSDAECWKAEVHTKEDLELLKKCITNAFKLYDVLRTD